jgi:hypothetical protein
VSQNESFQEYLADINKMFLTHGMEYLVMWKNIFPHHGLTIFLDDKNG